MPKLRDTTATYGIITRTLHWGMAVFLIGMVVLGFLFHWHLVPEGSRGFVYMIHKNTGLSLFLLVIIRIVWRFMNPTPPLPDSVSLWQKFAAQIVKGALYLSVLVFGLSGALMTLSRGGEVTYMNIIILKGIVPEDQAMSHFWNEAHWVVSWIMVGLVFLHILGALHHRYVLKDRVMQRMLGTS